jgi:hypothetical protein
MLTPTPPNPGRSNPFPSNAIAAKAPSTNTFTAGSSPSIPPNPGRSEAPVPGLPASRLVCQQPPAFPLPDVEMSKALPIYWRTAVFDALMVGAWVGLAVLAVALLGDFAFVLVETGFPC